MKSYRRYFQFVGLALLVATTGCGSLGKKGASKVSLVEPGTTLHVFNIMEQDEVLQVALSEQLLRVLPARLIKTANHEGDKNGTDDSGSDESDDSSDDSEDEVSAELETVRDAVDEYDALTLFSYQINGAFRSYKAFVVKNIHSTSEPIGNFTEYLQAIPEDGLLLLTTRYYFSSDMRALRIETNAGLYLKNPGEGKKSSRTHYSNELVYHTQIEESDPKAAADAWAENDGEKFTAAMDAGLAEIARLLLLDMSGGSAKKGPKKNWTIADMKKGEDIKITGTVVQSEGDRVIVRHASGVLMSIPSLGKSS